MLQRIVAENLSMIITGAFILVLLIGFFGFVIYLSLSTRLKEYFIDDGGKLSMGRLVIFLSIFFYVISAAYELVSKGTFPDIPLTLAGLIGALYGVNKFSPTTQFQRHDDHEEHHEEH